MLSMITKMFHNRINQLKILSMITQVFHNKTNQLKWITKYIHEIMELLKILN